MSSRYYILYSKLYVAVENRMENIIKISSPKSGEIVPQLLFHAQPCRRTTAAAASAGDGRCQTSCIVHEQAGHAVRHRHRRSGTIISGQRVCTPKPQLPTLRPAAFGSNAWLAGPCGARLSLNPAAAPCTVPAQALTAPSLPAQGCTIQNTRILLI